MLFSLHFRCRVHEVDLHVSTLVSFAWWIPCVFVPSALTRSDPLLSDAWGQGWSGVRRVFWPWALCGGGGAPYCRTLAGGLRAHLVAVFGPLWWCFPACEGLLVGLPCRGHFGSSCFSSFVSLGHVFVWVRPLLGWLALSLLSPWVTLLRWFPTCTV